MIFKKYKLKDLVDNFSVRARDCGGSDGLEFLGVSSEDGIVKSKSAAEHKGDEYKIIEKGCFAYNPYRINIGSIAYHNEDNKGLISPAYVIFKTKPNSIKDNLLFRFLKSTEGLRQIRFHGRGTVRQALRFEDLCKIEINIPSFKEQEKLISKLEIVENKSNHLTSILNHQLSIIRQLRQAFLIDVIEIEELKNDKKVNMDLLKKIKAEKTKLINEGKIKKNKPQSVILLEEIPNYTSQKLIWFRLGDFFNVEKGLIGIQKAVEGIYPLVVTSEERLSHNEYHFEGKAVIIPLVSSTGHGHASLKRIHYQEGKFAVGNILACITPKTPHFFNMKFMYRYLEMNKEFFFVEKMKGAANVSLKISSILETPVPLFPIEIQNKYEELTSICDNLENIIKEGIEINAKITQTIFREILGLEVISQKDELRGTKKKFKKFYTDEKNTFTKLNMKIVDILKTSDKPLPSNVVWNSSEYNKDVEAFYAELKRLIDIEKLVEEEKIGMESYLKLVNHED